MTSVAGHPKNRLYIDSGASLHALFNKELIEELQNLDRSFKIQAGGKPILMSQVGSLHQALRHLSLPVTMYHYSGIAIANLLSFAKLTDEYYIICNTRVDDAIYIYIYIYRARMTVNTYDFNKIINVTYITWTSVKITWMNIVILTL